jgi:hypothetical protein
MAAASNLFLSMRVIFSLLIVLLLLIVYFLYGHCQFAAADPWLKATPPGIKVLVLFVHTS